MTTPTERTLTPEARLAIHSYLLKYAVGVSTVVGVLAFLLGFTLSEQSKSLAAEKVAESVLQVGEAAQEARDVKNELVATQLEVDARVASIELAKQDAEAARDALQGQFVEMAADLLMVPGFREELAEAVAAEFMDSSSGPNSDWDRQSATLSVLAQAKLLPYELLATLDRAPAETLLELIWEALEARHASQKEPADWYVEATSGEELLNGLPVPNSGLSKGGW